eukprot:TRINITY_DN7190_c0_g1_i3.p1 TRINITY_DN7190_c0_g1~~TRINITY_DN7190_c0_g1_i3.p1  ORF type:complete len:386 (+),score=15.78 TRINITY_DN7190_c0_g1_i3:41-1198(+)
MMGAHPKVSVVCVRVCVCRLLIITILSVACGFAFFCIATKANPLRSMLLLARDRTQPPSYHGRAESNLCIDGHLVPQLIGLGAMKASTTTFYSKVVMSSGVVSIGKKEHHFFGNGPLTSEDKAGWVQQFPNCSIFKERAVTLDVTPDYLRRPVLTSANLAFVYGPLTARITFVVLLREPLSRSWSNFRMFRRVICHRDTTSLKCKVGFNELLKGYLSDPENLRQGELAAEISERCKFETLRASTFRDAPACMPYFYHRLFRANYYSEQLDSYFERFDSANFWICPMKYNVYSHHLGADMDLVTALWDHLGVPRASSSKVWENNGGQAVGLESVLDPDVLLRAKAEFGRIPSATAEVLAKSRSRLVGYTGEAGLKAAIQKWLEEGW